MTSQTENTKPDNADFMIYFNMDLDTETDEGRQKKMLKWEDWKQIKNRRRRKVVEDGRVCCLICQRFYAQDYLRKHVSTASHLRKEHDYFQIQME